MATIDQRSRWDDVGTTIPSGEAKYVVEEQPIAEYDNKHNSDVSLDITDIITFINDMSGTIVMWHGLIANIPTGWTLCDGTSGTPDLREQFVRGAPNATEAGGTGGSDAISAHTHDVTASGQLTGGSDPAKMYVTNVTTSSDGAFDNRPAYYEILYIMKT